MFLDLNGKGDGSPEEVFERMQVVVDNRNDVWDAVSTNIHIY